MTEQPKIIKSFLSQRCIGYTANTESVIECNVEYADSSKAIRYMVDRHDGKFCTLVEWWQVPPIAIWQSDVSI